MERLQKNKASRKLSQYLMNISWVLFKPNALRIGERGTRFLTVKPRLLKVAFATEHDKSLLLHNCMKLRSKNNPDSVRNVYVTPDLIPREQQQSKALRAKLAKINKGAKK